MRNHELLNADELHHGHGLMLHMGRKKQALYCMLALTTGQSLPQLKPQLVSQMQLSSLCDFPSIDITTITKYSLCE